MPTARSSRFDWLRPLIAIALLVFNAASLVAAYLLASAELDYGYFVGAAMFFGLWASVVGTNSRVSADQVIGIIGRLPRLTNATRVDRAA